MLHQHENGGALPIIETIEPNISGPFDKFTVLHW